MSRPAPEPPIDAPAMAAAVDPKKLAAFFLRAGRLRWRKMLLPLVAGAVLAPVAAKYLSKQAWESSGVMLYTPPPIPENQRGLYSPPDLNTLVGLVKSPDVLARVRDDFALTVPESLLDKLFKVTVPRNTQTVTVTLQWGEADTAAAMTNRLMERFAEQVREHRWRKMDGYLADCAAREEAGTARHAAAVAAYQAYLSKHHLYDLAAEAEAARREVEMHQKVRADALRDVASVAAQRDRVSKEIEDMRRTDAAEADAAKKFDADLESVADNRRRQDRLRELIEDDQRRQQLLAELGVRRKEFERVSALRTTGAVSQTEVEVAEKEIILITAKLNDSEQVKGWKAELTKIDAVVVPKGPSKSLGSPIIHQTLFRHLELDLRRVGLEKELVESEKALTALRRRQAEIQALTRQADGFQKEIEAADEERRKVADQTALFRRLRNQQATEFAVVTPARPGPYPVSSNRKLILLAVLAAAGAAAACRAATAEWRANHHGGRWAAVRTGVPVLGDLRPDDVISHRLAASAIRAWRPEYGATLLLLGDGSADPFPWAVRLGRRLAARDERVLVVDCRVGEMAVAGGDGLTGLGNYLRFEADEIDVLLAPDDSAGLEVLPAGDAPTLDILASRRMAALVAGFRTRYSCVLLVGPDLARHDGVEILSGYADGTVAVLSSEAEAALPIVAGRLGGQLCGLIV